MTKDEIKKAIEKAEQFKAEVKADGLRIGLDEQKAEETATRCAYSYLKALFETYLLF